MWECGPQGRQLLRFPSTAPVQGEGRSGLEDQGTPSSHLVGEGAGTRTLNLGLQDTRFTDAETERIVRNPRVLGGEPIVRDTRIPVRSIILAAREYGGVAAALEVYPQLTTDDANDALAFGGANKAEVERYIRENLAED